MGLTSMFRHTPNHIKLVRDCYPHSKTAVEPESNALGKLTFYTKRRPIKLSKVGKALLKRSQKSSEPIGYLCITLSILKHLLDECRNDVNVFSLEAMAIIDIALKRGHEASKLSQSNPHTVLELYEKTAGTFYALATFSQAPAIEESAYIRLLREFCGLVREDKLLQLRLIGLHALEGVVSSELFQQLDFEEQAHLVMPTLLLALMDVGGDPYILHDNPPTSNASASSSSARLRPASDPVRPSLHDRRARSIRIAKGLEGTDKPPGKEDSARAAYRCLRSAFRYAQPRHLEVFLAETTAYFDERPETWKSVGWCCWLGARYMEWTQAQYRFAIVKYWLDELDSRSATSQNSQRQETVLAMLIDQLSSPKTSVVNLALSDVLSTLIDQIVLTPEKTSLKEGILALSSHIYYPEQINDLVGDMLIAVVEIIDTPKDPATGRQKSEDAKLALLDCCHDMVDKKGGSGVKLSGEQMNTGLTILGDPSSRVRRAYLRFLQTVFQFGSAQSSTLQSPTSNGAQSDLPAITVQSSGSYTPQANDTSRFTRDVQMRLFSHIQHNSDLSEQESDAITAVLQASYAKRNPQIVLDCVPILVSWQNSDQADSTSAVKAFVMTSLQAIATTWQAPPPSTSSVESMITAIASSSSLQEATSLSSQQLQERLSQPYSISPLSPRNSISTYQHTRRPRSPHGSFSQKSMAHSIRNRLSGPSSIFTTSLADLKQSLGQPGTANGIGHHQQNNGSPSRSITGASTAASSFVDRIPSTPPNGGTINGHHQGHLSPRSMQAQRKPRLDRIIGSTDATSYASPGSSNTSTKITSPPYQLS